MWIKSGAKSFYLVYEEIFYFQSRLFSHKPAKKKVFLQRTSVLKNEARIGKSKRKIEKGTSASPPLEWVNYPVSGRTWDRTPYYCLRR